MRVGWDDDFGQVVQRGELIFCKKKAAPRVQLRLIAVAAQSVRLLLPPPSLSLTRVVALDLAFLQLIGQVVTGTPA